MQHIQVSDTDLIHRFVDGDEDAFTMIILRYEHLLFGIACQMLVDADLAKDVCQLTWIQLFLKKPVRPGVSLRHWLVTVVSRRCLDELRRKKKNAFLFSFLDQRNEDQRYEDEDSFSNALRDSKLLPEQVAEYQEYLRLVCSAVTNLPEKYRLSLTLHIFGEYSYQEIGHRLCEPESTIKTRVWRARILLKKSMEWEMRCM